MAPIERDTKAEEEQRLQDGDNKAVNDSPKKVAQAESLKSSEKSSDIKENGSVDDGPGSSYMSEEGPTTPTTSPRRHRRERTWSSSAKDETLLLTRQRTIYTAGRPPWYNAQGQLVEPFVIGICGGSASGKTTVARKIIEALNVPWVTLLSMDSFYKVLNEEQHKLADENQFNFDHPDAFDFELLIETLKKLKEGKRVEVPIYNFVTHSREKRFKFMYGANVIIFEGILCFTNKELLNMMDMKIFIDTDSDIRLARRLQRDITDRGRDLEGCLAQYERFVKPSFDHYIAPSMVHADIIVPRAGPEAADEAGGVPLGPAAAQHPAACSADPAAPGHPHVHPQPGHQAGRVHLLLGAAHAPPHGVHGRAAALRGRQRGDAPGHQLQGQEDCGGEDLRRVDPAGG